MTADIFDQATEREEAGREEAIENVIYAWRKSAQNPSAETCTDCGEPIPQARRDAAPGCTRCTDCADFHERRKRIG